jgi:hypothetical protein
VTLERHVKLFPSDGFAPAHPFEPSPRRFPQGRGVAKILNSASWRYVAKLPQLYCLGVKMSAKDCFYE